MENWYAAGDNKRVLNLQVIADAMANFNANSSGLLLNKRVETVNFAGIVSAFDNLAAQGFGGNRTNAETVLRPSGGLGQAGLML